MSRASIVRVLVLPVIVLVGFLGWQIPHDKKDRAPLTLPPGSAPVGAASYKVPDKAIVVAPNGDDTASGTRKKPLRTVAKAIAKAPSGGTIVLRGGAYHESVQIPAGKKVTIQNQPGEAAWFDGTSPVGGWAHEDGVWVKDGWTARFDSSPSYTRGAPPDGNRDFQFLDPKYPLAAHPDQVWVGGTALRQVGTRAEVRQGTFYVDDLAQRLYVGSDPRGKDVRASTLEDAITIQGAGTVLRGVGVRGYATSLPEIATVKVTAPDVTVENVIVKQSATSALTVSQAPRARLNRITLADNGLLGLHANNADDLRVDSARFEHNNTEHFKFSPVSGGMKITRSRKVAVLNTVAVGNLGKGIWVDESVYDVTLAGNRVVRNADHGLDLELSAKAVVAGNLVRDNGGDGIKINNTSDVQLWNNTFVGNGRTLHLVQDKRRASNPADPGHDPRQKGPDPEMTWLLGKITASNNTFADSRAGAACMVCVEDHSHERSAAQMDIRLNGNAYLRRNDQTPQWLVVWSRGKGGPATFGSLAEFKASTGQEPQGIADDHGTAAAPTGGIAHTMTTRADTAARPLPEPIARLLGKPAGTRHMGAWSL
jgi:parallel beta-helix repeat protein